MRDSSPFEAIGQIVVVLAIIAIAVWLTRHPLFAVWGFFAYGTWQLGDRRWWTLPLGVGVATAGTWLGRMLAVSVVQWHPWWFVATCLGILAVLEFTDPSSRWAWRRARPAPAPRCNAAAAPSRPATGPEAVAIWPSATPAESALPPLLLDASGRPIPRSRQG
jgi:hypothetical protein